MLGEKLCVFLNQTQPNQHTFTMFIEVQRNQENQKHKQKTS